MNIISSRLISLMRYIELRLTSISITGLIFGCIYAIMLMICTSGSIGFLASFSQGLMLPIYDITGFAAGLLDFPAPITL